MSINYVKFGSGNRNMLIIPGLSLKPVTGDVQAIANAYELFSNDFTVYLFDQREDVEKGYSIEDMADDALAKIDELGLKDIYLYGVSMGGMLSQYMVLKRPELFKKLVLCSNVSKVENNEAFDSWYKNAEDKNINKLLESFMYYIYTKEFNDMYLSLFKKMNSDISDRELELLKIRIEAMKGFDLYDIVNNKVPCLVLGSKKDKVFTVEQMNQLVKNMNADYYFYDDYAHSIYDECADVKDRIYKFFMN